jgi:alpha-N-arabinofuranosidase
LRTRIEVDASAVDARIDRRIYGHFIENMARCLYGGLLVNERPGDPRGPWKMREGIVKTVKELVPPVVRWPGGLYADGYHWRDGIGPAEARPLRRKQVLVPLRPGHQGPRPEHLRLGRVHGAN